MNFKKTILIFSLFIMALVIAGCASKTAPVQTQKIGSCGDSVCSSTEMNSGTCPADCVQEQQQEMQEEVEETQNFGNCLNEGEVQPATPDAMQCCSGLELIGPKESTEKGNNGFCTSLCGNGVCNDATESQKNCPSDCQVIMDSQITCEGAGTSKEGWYQNDKIISYAKCAGCDAECRNKGTLSEGWYNTCNDKQIKRVCN